MRIVFLVLLATVPLLTLAAPTVLIDQGQPYEIVPVEGAIADERWYLGELVEYPIMFEVRSDNAFTFVAEVMQPANQTLAPFSLILIRQNDRGGGVKEVARMHVPVTEWAVVNDRELGLRLSHSPLIFESVEPGIYRLEISTPENAGDFVLRIGSDTVSQGYFEALATTRAVQAHFGYSIVTLLQSSLVYQPLGILLALLSIYKIWRWRRQTQVHGTT